MVAGHEGFAGGVAKDGALAAHGLGDEERSHAGEAQRRGMELVELKVGELGPGLEGQREPFAAGDLGFVVCE
ncbi:MAG: hypothetical protein U0547_05770 [Dehalococcoidia bacterium]